MKIKQLEQIKVVADCSPQEFEERVNRIHDELAEEGLITKTIYDIRSFRAIIIFKKEIMIPQDIRDECHLKGVYKHCIDCEQFQRNDDGRLKRGYCRMHNQSVRKDAEACVDFYTMKERWEK